MNRKPHRSKAKPISGPVVVEDAIQGEGWGKGGAVKVGLPGHVSPAGTPEPNEAERARRGSGGRVIFLVPLPLVTAQGLIHRFFFCYREL
jgi:hypothetical protein